MMLTLYSGILSGILADILFWHSIWHLFFYQTFYLASILTFLFDMGTAGPPNSWPRMPATVTGSWSDSYGELGARCFHRMQTL